MSKLTKIPKSWVFIIFITAFLGFYKLPYYVSTPGKAADLSKIVKVDGGSEAEGSFSLTTIRMGQANIVQYGLALVKDYYEIFPADQIRQQGETTDEYNHRQLYMMEDSKEQATVVAYNKAGKGIDITYNGVYVMSIIDGMPAEGHLQIGDRIYSIDGQNMQSSEEFIKYISTKKAGETIQLRLERNGKKMDVQVALAKFPQKQVESGIGNKAGLGILLVTDRKVEVNPIVDIDSSQIGGPSAGLMFSLEIYNQLMKEDITKGYKIAGTGTISYEGEVGPIGGIEQKIVAADQSDVELFFAPNEKGKSRIDLNGKKVPTNYEAALKTARNINTDMKIIPVDTFDEALEYLESLPLKE